MAEAQNSTYFRQNDDGSTSLMMGGNELTYEQYSALAGVTPGTAAVSKALVLDGDGAIAGIPSVGAANLALTDTLKIDTVSQALTYAIALAGGANNHCRATITAKDAAGATVTGVQRVEVYISESATGIGLTADSASGALTAATGTILSVLTAKKHVIALTDANGVLVLDLEDSAEPADQYFVAVRPFGSLVVSAASGTNWQ